MKYFVAGGAGFIGSHLVDKLLAEGHSVVVFDNLSSGNELFLVGHRSSKRLKLIKGDLREFGKVKAAMKGCSFVFNMAANPDIRKGGQNPRLDMDLNVHTLMNILEAMRANKIKKIGFASSGTIYGENGTKQSQEKAITSLPISFYGASKLYSEALLSAYSHMFGFQVWIFRFANIVGSRATHGVILDFLNKLQKDPKKLEILGNGRQTKGYMHVSDCVSAMTYLVRKANKDVNIYNLAARGTTSVDYIAREIIKVNELKGVKLIHTGGDRGWRGDIPKSKLSSRKLANIGYASLYNSNAAVHKAIMEISRGYTWK